LFYNKFLKSCFLKNVISSILVLALVAFLTFSTVQTAYSNGNISDTRETTVLNVLDFGAKGDGVTDDSHAFQRAIDDASSRDVTLLIPASDTPYLIRTTLRLRSNTHIRGYGATLFMPSAPEKINLLWSSSRDFISNVTIEGLTLKSKHDRIGSNHHKNGLTSRIQGIYLLGVNNLQLKDITMHNMAAGFKLTWAVNGGLNRNIKVDNLRVYNAGTALLVHSTDNFIMTNSILCARGGSGRFQHSAYISGDTSNFLFDNVAFKNSSGGGIHLYNGHDDKAAPQNIEFRNSVIDNVRTGLYIFSGSKDITISDLTMTNYARAFEIWDSSNIDIQNVAISRQTQVFGSDIGYGFHIRNSSDINISDVAINGDDKVGQVFLMSRTTSNINISSVKVNGLNNNQFVFANVGSLIRKVVVKNSTVEWTNTSWHRISLRGVGSDAIFRNNTFINKGREARSLSFNTLGTNVLLENNSYKGFARISHPWDHATLLNNIRLPQAH